MKKVVKKDSRVSREMLTNSFPNETLKERLMRSRAIDFNENFTVENLGNGYMKILPKDENKLVKI